MDSVMDLPGTDPTFQRISKAARYDGLIPGTAVIRGNVERVADAVCCGEPGATAAEVPSEKPKSFLIAIQGPSAGLRKGSGRHLVLRVAGAVTSQEVGSKGKTGIGRALIFSPVPIWKSQVRVSCRILEFLLIQLQQLSMPRAKGRSSVGKIGSRSQLTVRTFHHDLMMGPNKVVIATDQR